MIIRSWCHDVTIEADHVQKPRDILKLIILTLFQKNVLKIGINLPIHLKLQYVVTIYGLHHYVKFQNDRSAIFRVTGIFECCPSNGSCEKMNSFMENQILGCYTEDVEALLDINMCSGFWGGSAIFWVTKLCN